MSLIMQGEVITIINKNKKEDGSLYARLLQIQEVTDKDGHKNTIDVLDFDLTRKVEVGKDVSLPVFAAIWQKEDKFGKKLGLPEIQFKAQNFNNGGNGSTAVASAQKGVKV